ncbi:hypothetical protein BH10BAC3_BH10BAC3_26910 [soil metagenome]
MEKLLPFLHCIAGKGKSFVCKHSFITMLVFKISPDVETIIVTVHQK